MQRFFVVFWMDLGGKHVLNKLIKKRINKIDYFLFCNAFNWYLWLVFSRCPGGFRKVRRPGGIHFHLSWYLSGSMVPSHDESFFRLNPGR